VQNLKQSSATAECRQFRRVARKTYKVLSRPSFLRQRI
jgi:hypothetical protein